jgi:hypothetical protein
MSNEFFASTNAVENPSTITTEDRLATPRPKSRVIRFIAQLVSFVFHPLFITGYIVAFLLFVHPYVFSGFSTKIRVLRLTSVVLLTAFFPAFVVFLLRQLGLIQSIFLRTQKDRIIPYIASMFFFFWIFHVSRNLRDSPPVFVGLLLGVFISSIAALMANIYFKVSMHAISMGAMICFFVWLAMQGNFSMGIYISLAILVAGIVCTSRLIVSDHYPFEVYAGLFLGVISQAVATVFV